jgi:hypothetical protein
MHTEISMRKRIRSTATAVALLFVLLHENRAVATTAIISSASATTAAATATSVGIAKLDGPVAHVLSGGVLVRTVACPVPPEGRPRLRGARPETARPPRLPEPLVVSRRVSVRGAIMVGGQKIQVGLAHARKTVEVTVAPGTYQITVETGITVIAARTTSRDIRRHKAPDYG